MHWFWRFAAPALAAAMALPAESGAKSPDVAPRAGQVAPPGWIAVTPGGDTDCGLDTPYRFFFHEGPDPSKLLIWFEGGGACWEWVSCSGMFDATVADDELDDFRGIFDFGHPGNPFGDFSMLFVPYCTASWSRAPTTA